MASHSITETIMSTHVLAGSLCKTSPGAGIWQQFWCNHMAWREEKARTQVGQHLLRRSDEDLALLGLSPHAIAHLRQYGRLPNPLAR